MLVGITVMILIVLSLLSVIIGNNFLGGITEVGVDNEALVDGLSNTFEVASETILFQIDTTSLIVAGIAILATLIVIALITGITVLASGLNPQSSKIVIFVGTYIGIWAVLSILAFNLIFSIEVFGSVIYIGLTLAYTVGVVQKISGGNN